MSQSHYYVYYIMPRTDAQGHKCGRAATWLMGLMVGSTISQQTHCCSKKKSVSQKCNQYAEPTKQYSLRTELIPMEDRLCSRLAVWLAESSGLLTPVQH